jgi:hypothetical protein
MSHHLRWMPEPSEESLMQSSQASFVRATTCRCVGCGSTAKQLLHSIHSYGGNEREESNGSQEEQRDESEHRVIGQPQPNATNEREHARAFLVKERPLPCLFFSR